jgi:trimethylamine-N-oxide reductase (cytochrome c), cytochrome c-type subunit TorC
MGDQDKTKRRVLGMGSAMLLFIGGIFGIIFWGGFNTFMEYTNTYEFCTSCHEMNTVRDEYTKSAHAHNTSGVPAICSDCHVPKPWGAKLWRKIKASNELYHKFITGSIDTPEKFKAKRLQLAQNVWASMQATDSRECRNCHDPKTMVLAGQSDLAQKRHKQELLTGNQTCIDCHKGIAHQLPDLSKQYASHFEQIQSAPAAAKGDMVSVLSPLKIRQKEEEASMVLAEIDAGSNLKVVEIKGKLVKVSATYWDREQAPTLLEDFLRPIRAGRLTFDGMDAVKVIEAKKDPHTELEWRKVTIEGWTSGEYLRKQSDDIWSYAKDLYEGDCQLCHKLNAIEKYQVVEWPVRIKRMRRYTKLDMPQQKLLARYLQRRRYDMGPINGER